MSYIGRDILYIPPNIKVLTYKNFIIAKGPCGVLKKKIMIGVNIKKVADNKVLLTPRNEKKNNKFFLKEWGTLKVALWNMFFGVFKKYASKLIFVGVGYRFFLSKKRRLVKMRLGFSHRLIFKLPFGFNLKKVNKRPPTFVLEHIDYIKLRTITFALQKKKYPEPYKGKGICRPNQFIRRKEGKKRKT